MAKLLSVNAHWLRLRPDAELVALVQPFLADLGLAVDEPAGRRLLAGMDGLKSRARTLVELAANSTIYVRPRPIPLDAKAAALLDAGLRQRLTSLVRPLAAAAEWTEPAIESVCRATAEALGVGFGKLAQALRCALTGTTVSPGLFEVMAVLGRDETLARLEDAAHGRNAAVQ
jgi:glutamyl-tRNA synthetase